MSAEPLPYRFIQRLAALPFVEGLYLFGSRARGQHGPRADIDLALWCPQATPADWQRVLDVVEDADTLLRIDCVRLDAEAPGSTLRRNIERDMIPLHGQAHAS